MHNLDLEAYQALAVKLKNDINKQQEIIECIGDKNKVQLEWMDLLENLMLNYFGEKKSRDMMNEMVEKYPVKDGENKDDPYMLTMQSKLFEMVSIIFGND